MVSISQAHLFSPSMVSEIGGTPDQFSRIIAKECKRRDTGKVKRQAAG